jgi:hypothetical protein
MAIFSNWCLGVSHLASAFEGRQARWPPWPGTRTATALGPPLGKAAISLFGPVPTVLADAVSHLLSAAGIRALGGGEPRRARTDYLRLRAGDLLDGWR